MTVASLGLPYFAYGSNLLAARLQQANRCPSAQPLAVAQLAGYRLSFEKRSNVDGSGKCTIHCSADHDVLGVLYQVPPHEQQALHLVEGVGLGYDLVQLEVQTPAGAVTAAFAYQAQAEWLSPDLVPMDWYRDLVLAGALEHQLDETLIAMLRATRSQRDPDLARSERERAPLPEGFGR